MKLIIGHIFGCCVVSIFLIRLICEFGQIFCFFFVFPLYFTDLLFFFLLFFIFLHFLFLFSIFHFDVTFFKFEFAFEFPLFAVALPCFENFGSHFYAWAMEIFRNHEISSVQDLAGGCWTGSLISVVFFAFFFVLGDVFWWVYSGRFFLSVYGHARVVGKLEWVQHSFPVCWIFGNGGLDEEPW